MNVRLLFVVYFLGMGYLSPSAASAKATFSFTYFDVVNGNGMGFDDPVLGADRIAAVEATAAAMGDRISQTATVEVGVAPSIMDGTGGGNRP